MLEPAKHERAPYPEHPDRCTAQAGHTQCPYLKVPGTDVCEIHAYHNRQRVSLTQNRKIYLAAQWQADAGPFADSDEIKSLRQEIGILRLLLFRMMESCKSPNDLLMRHSSISELILKIQKVVEACHKLEAASGGLLDKDHLSSFGLTVINLVSTYINDPDTLRKFAGALVEEIKKIGQPDYANRG
jgi:hypothetical protein